MRELGKIVIFLGVLSLFMYMLYINFIHFKNFYQRKYLCCLMILGLGLITIGTFLDALSSCINVNFKVLISMSFTIGGGIFAVYLILWSTHIKTTIINLNKYVYIDNMTGIYNRKGFENLFSKKILSKELFFIMVFDLDKTKTINDNFGHLNGDKYICNAAKIINEEVCKNGFAARIGGDEFIAFLENINENEVEKIKEAIKIRVSNIFAKQDTKVSIGYSKYKIDGEEFEELIRIADLRMYEDKNKTKNINLINIE